MSRLASRANQMLESWGVNARRLAAAPGGQWRLRSDYREYRRQLMEAAAPNEFPVGRRYRIFWEKAAEAGYVGGHYFHQDLLVAREVFEQRPTRHIDVGSSIHGFVSHVASFRTIEVIDIRPVINPVAGIMFIQQDATQLGPEWDGAADSVSCLHALEHFGLGRYGDRIDPDGWRRGLDGLTRLVQPGGRLYLSVPTGATQRVDFNAHRVFRLPFLRDLLTQDFSIDRLAFVDDEGGLLSDVDPFGAESERSFGCTYGCSIWVLRKL